MNDDEPLDRFTHYPEGKGNQTISLFIASGSMAVLAMSVLVCNSFFRIPELIVAISIILGIVSFALSIGGIQVGVSEIKYSTKWVKTGLIGHIVIVAVPALLLIYGIVMLFITLV